MRYVFNVYKSDAPIRFAEAFAMTGVSVGSRTSFAAVTWPSFDNRSDSSAAVP